MSETAEIWAQHKEIVKKTVALKRQKEKIANSRNLVEEKNRELEATLEKLKSTQTKLIAAEKMASLGTAHGRNRTRNQQSYQFCQRKYKSNQTRL